MFEVLLCTSKKRKPSSFLERIAVLFSLKHFAKQLETKCFSRLAFFFAEESRSFSILGISLKIVPLLHPNIL